MPELGSAFDEALLFAALVHRRQRRKGGDIPYVSHLLAVAALVLEAGGDEDQAVAALLHHTVEDHPDQVSFALLAERFGDRVTNIVRECSDTEEYPKPPWRERKDAYLRHLRLQHADAVLVSLADKLHNTRSTLRDLRFTGPGVWDRFNAGRDEQLWYYAAVHASSRSDCRRSR